VILDKSLIQQISKLTLEGIGVAMREAGMDEAQKAIFLEKFAEYWMAMVETMLNKGGKA
jgi:hypothetical protein